MIRPAAKEVVAADCGAGSLAYGWATVQYKVGPYDLYKWSYWGTISGGKYSMSGVAT